MPESVGPEDSDFDRLYAKWVKEGSPFQFDELGDFGGRLWKVHDRDNTDGPTFLLMAAAGPTPSGYNADDGTYKSADWEPQSGYEVEMQDNGIRVLEGPGGEGDLRIKFKDQPRDITV